MLERYSENAIMAKARAMYGKNIKPSQFNDMINCKTVSEIAGYLKNETHFSKALHSIKESTIHRGQLEMMLNREMFESFAKLYRYSNIKAENMFKYVVLEEEIEEVLKMIKLLKSGNSDKYILQLPAYLIQKANIDFMGLAKVRSYKELLKFLHKEPIFDVLEKHLLACEDTHDIDYLHCEYDMYCHLFDKLHEMIEKTYKGAIKQQLLELVNLRIELLNIERIFRAKTYHNMTNEEIDERLYKTYYKLNKNTLKKLVETKDSEDFQKQLLNSSYQKLVSQEDFDFIEHMTKRIQLHINRKYLRNSMGAEVSFYAFVLLSKVEIANVTNIIEGVRYQIPKEEIQKLINI